ncbi:DUF4440 domain-containing protein [Marinicella sp. W31]|uniref:DUF4440 domain-containing protein n=1 Tax=Marinicella sp. W31 TaxID=3023713 RepID=UPI0037577854
MKLTLVLSLILALFTSTTQAEERRHIPEYKVYGTTNKQNQQDLDTFLKKYKSAWANQDTEKLMQLHVPNTEWINAYARIFQNRTGLGEFLRDRLFPNFRAQVSIQEMGKLKRISTRFLGENVAVLHMYTDGNRGESRNSGESHRRTHLHLVLQKTKKGWQVAHTAIMDAR